MHSEGSTLEDLDGPSVTSSDPNERKLARRYRIQRRLEALTKQTRTQAEEVVEKTPIERQILDSIDLLDKLSFEGAEVISSVRVANDARELQRRKDQKKTKEKLWEILEEEDRECTERYHNTIEKWPEILASKDPVNVHSEMAAQNVKCLEILARKDALIAELRRELENTDLNFANEQKKQTEDINQLVERMENQVRNMAKIYRHELFLIDQVIESERKMLLQTAVEKWDVLYKKLIDDSAQGMGTKKQIMREYEEEMGKAIVEHQEQFRSQKISLELEIQKLQQEVEDMKALCLMNVEKLDYSFAVLKQREEENIIVKNQQKRRINKLQDTVNRLKKNYSALEESTRLEIQKLTDQVLKTHKGILDLKEKLDYFTLINDKKYTQIWNMNIESANKLFEKILTADKIIHEQTLGLKWQPPTEKLLRKEDLTSYCGAMCALREEKLEAIKRRTISKSYKTATTLEEINLERSLLNRIIEQICDQCGFFVEESLQRLLSNYAIKDQMVIRLDNVFQALNITSEQELQFLLNFFLPYAYCRICTTKTISKPRICLPTESSSQTTTDILNVCEECVELKPEEIRLISAVDDVLGYNKFCGHYDCDPSSTTNTSSRTSNSPNEENVTASATDISKSLKSTDESDESKRKLLCDKGHLLEIETACVSKAMQEFVERYEFVQREKILPSLDTEKKRNTVSRNMTTKDITIFWKRYQDIFSKDRERLWDILLVGLKKYYDILKERHHLNTETESLRKQNAELRRLLKTYASEHECGDITQEDLIILRNII